MISVEEYLATSYESDCDYPDGEVVERNWRYESDDGVFVLLELRARVKPARRPVPDICVTLGFPDEQILTKPPFLCIEILSPEDRMTRFIQRINDYLEMGVAYVWVLDPKLKLAYTATAAEGLRELKSNVPLNKIFA